MNRDHAFDEIVNILSTDTSDMEKTLQIQAIIDKNRKLTFKTVQELLNYGFVVPSYQRGYKWKEQQVADLLNDILDFSETDHSKDQFYCLQPIIVKKEGGKWSVIDGQQRLTTIYLILTHLEAKSFTLEYNTRTESKEFLENLKDDGFHSTKNDARNIDIHHFSNAMKTIQAWFSELDAEAIDKWRETLLKKTKVIWYNPDTETEYQSETAIFSRINSGKIPLTNSELIRALFIHCSKVEGNEPASILSQQKISSEWDFIEQQLHDEDFWCFVTLGETIKPEDYPNRIEFFFDLVEQKENGTAKSDDLYSSFRMYNGWITGQEKSKSVAERWQEIKNLYYRFHEWYIDDELYHLTGFARLGRIELGVKTLLFWADEKTQSGLMKKIKETILEKLLKCELRGKLDELCYGDGDVGKTLLLHNIATYNQQNERFPFWNYIHQDWDIEHVHARADKVPEDKRDKFMRDWIDFLSAPRIKGKLKHLNVDISDLEKTRSEKLFDTFQETLVTVLDQISDGMDENSISNLVLLDRGTNRSYKDAPFPEKRREIMEREAKGELFIPVCTRNVFGKAYSTGNDLSLDFWGAEDRLKYIDAMKRSIGAFIMEGE